MSDRVWFPVLETNTCETAAKVGSDTATRQLARRSASGLFVFKETLPPRAARSGFSIYEISRKKIAGAPVVVTKLGSGES
jgi:hypothetical protein